MHVVAFDVPQDGDTFGQRGVQGEEGGHGVAIADVDGESGEVGRDEGGYQVGVVVVVGVDVAQGEVAEGGEGGGGGH